MPRDYGYYPDHEPRIAADLAARQSHGKELARMREAALYLPEDDSLTAEKCITSRLTDGGAVSLHRTGPYAWLYRFYTAKEVSAGWDNETGQINPVEE